MYYSGSFGGENEDADVIARQLSSASPDFSHPSGTEIVKNHNFANKNIKVDPGNEY